MSQSLSVGADAGATKPFELTQQQVMFFKTFGFLHVPKLFAAEAQQLSEGFEEVFATVEPQVLPTHDPLHFTEDPRFTDLLRTIIPSIVEASSMLLWLKTDDRVLGVVDGLLGEDYSYRGSDGNRYNCSVNWHPDIYNSPIERLHLKLMFYLDLLTRETGALRVMPGTSFYESEYATLLRDQLAHPDRVEEVFGVRPEEIPSWPIEVEPGDLIVDNFRTLHGSFRGGEARRLFTMNYRDGSGDDA